MKIEITYDIFHACENCGLNDKPEETVTFDFKQHLKLKRSYCDVCEIEPIDMPEDITFHAPDIICDMSYSVSELLELLTQFYEQIEQQIRIKKLEVIEK